MTIFFICSKSAKYFFRLFKVCKAKWLLICFACSKSAKWLLIFLNDYSLSDSNSDFGFDSVSDSNSDSDSDSYSDSDFKSVFMNLDMFIFFVLYLHSSK